MSYYPDEGKKMFKSTKSQFAIRKLSKGAVAVLLTFGIFANTTSGIVSATVNDGIDISAIEIRGGVQQILLNLQ